MAQTLKHLVAKAVLDPVFKSQLLADFEGTAKEEGVHVTEHQLKAFKNVKESDWDLVEKVIGDTLISTCACRVT